MIRRLRSLLTLLLLAMGTFAEAQQRTKIPRIGFLNAGSVTTSQKGFLHEFRNLGYIEGKTVAIEYRFADGKLDRVPALSDELVGIKVDVLVTDGLNDALACQERYRNYPPSYFWEPYLILSGLD